MYGMLVLGAISAIVRFQTGRRNPGRLAESSGLVFSIIAEVYFLVKFPFDFSHFADPLPNALEFLIDWVSGTLAKILLSFAIVVSVIMCIYGLVMYFAVRERLATVTEAPEPPEVPEVEGPEETSESE
jgi:type IV secretory pathway VirB2 component (pilin)